MHIIPLGSGSARLGSSIPPQPPELLELVALLELVTPLDVLELVVLLELVAPPTLELLEVLEMLVELELSPLPLLPVELLGPACDPVLPPPPASPPPAPLR